jgi:Nif-specific regulatory protein
MLHYEWPGNVRELENTIERLVVMARGKTVTEAELPMAIRNRSVNSRLTIQMKDALPSAIEEIERGRIIEALNKTGWVQARAAKMLGLSCRQIGYKITKYKIRQTQTDLQ